MRSPFATAGIAAAVLLGVLAAALPGASGAYVAKIANSTNTVGSAAYFTCGAAYASDRGSALFQLGLSEAATTTPATAADISGNGRNGTYQGTMQTTSTGVACSRDGGTAYVLDGRTAYVSTSTQQTNPTTFSIEVWFKTSTASGKLAGFGNVQTGSSSQYDRHLYVTTGGLLAFGLYNGGYKVVTTSSVVTDGAWHHVVATEAPTGTAAGMTLYLDGQKVAADATATSPQNTTGWWRFGWDNQGSWPNAGTNAYFTGAMRGAAVYTVALTATQVLNHYAAGR